MTIEEIYKDKQFLNYCIALGGKAYGEDLFMEVLLIYMESVIQHDNPAGYFKKTAYFIWANPRSKFNKKYRPQEVDADILDATWKQEEDIVYQEKLKIAEEILSKPAIDKRDNYINGVYKAYLEYGTYRKLEEASGVSVNCLYKAVMKFKDKVDVIHKRNNNKRRNSNFIS